MEEFYNDQDAFDKICGNCEGVDILAVTEDDVRVQARYFAEQGDPCSEEMICAAIAALHVMQEEMGIKETL